MRFKPLALQVLQQILLYAVLFWLLVSAVRAGLLFSQGQKHLAEIPDTVNTLYMPLLAQSVWDVELATTQKELASISAINGVESVLLETRLGQRLRYVRPHSDGEHHNIYRLDVHLNHGNRESLGTLTLYVSNTLVQREIANDLISSMAQRVLDFMALALLIVFILRRRFVVPVQQLAQAARAFVPGEPAPAFRLQYPAGVEDEMTQLLASFNAMRASINNHLAERKRYETALKQARDELASRVEERTARLDRLLNFQQLISAVSSRFINIPLDEIDGAMEQTLAQIGTFMEVDRCYLIGVDQLQVVSMVHEWQAAGIAPGAEGLDFAPLSSRPALFATLLREGVLNIPNCRQIPSFGHTQTQCDIQSLLMIRIDYLDQPVGVFGCDMVHSPRQWQDEEQLLVRLLGDMFANMIIRRQQLHALSDTQQQLEEANAHLARMALSDSLTGLANRRHFDEEKRQAFDKARRKGAPFALIMLDIDFFKEYNDHYGHQAGDQCLQRLAALLTSLFTYPGELPARIGGEEFAVLLPGIDYQGALKRAEALRQAVWDLNMPHANSRIADRVTVSLGAIAMDPGLHSGVEQMIADADAALYRAKASGRNCIG
ncbi:diguanylate cyclase domain-containing protein [Paludibacterium purpuratum]|uniref:diguanylate cyclase n=1 Tax=Paludibacterium purpuratum TaxID=1144873 RepID=A0A4V6PZ83_9NEIS|nr:diguanylate cyclase [Paludibacterium purpuratum]TDR78387.1 diguanylate cyclase (GGDEF)-like protein [Paludibacterium purpuratum]